MKVDRVVVQEMTSMPEWNLPSAMLGTVLHLEKFAAAT